MSDSKGRMGIPLGRVLVRLRLEAKLTQEQLAEKVTFKTSAASISRIKDGRKPINDDELASILKAIGTPKAEEFNKFLHEDWDVLERPAFDHPNRKNLTPSGCGRGRTVVAATSTGRGNATTRNAGPDHPTDHLWLEDSAVHRRNFPGKSPVRRLKAAPDESHRGRALARSHQFPSTSRVHRQIPS